MPEKNVTKQVIVRFFAPDMRKLKMTAKQLSVTSPDLKLGLYGQADEILVVLNAQSYAEAAAIQLTEAGAEAFEKAMGDSAYGRGKGGLAYVAAGEMIENRAIITAADDATGELLENEFKATKRGDQVFDFGDESYLNEKIAAKIKKAATFEPEENTPPYQAAADYAVAAAKCTKSDFGACIKGLDSDKIYAALAHGKYVYIREIPQGKDAPKCAALSLLDMARRLLIGADIPYAKAFKAGQEIDWDVAAQTPAPKAKKAAGAKVASFADSDDAVYSAPKKKAKAASNGGGKVVPIVVLCVLLVALAFAVYYLLNTFFFNKTSIDIDTDTSSSIAASADAGSVAAPETVPAEGEAAPAEGTGETVPTEGAAPVEGEVTTPTDTTTQAQSSANTGVVHPFG